MLLQPNHDYCDACNGKGEFVCCDGGCLRSFHLTCLEPPLDIDQVPEDSWYCKACRAEIVSREITLLQKSNSKTSLSLVGEGMAVRRASAWGPPWLTVSILNLQEPPPRPERGFFRELIAKVDRENPKAFELNPEIKALYKHGQSPPAR